MENQGKCERVSSYITLQNGTSYICNKYTVEANKLECINMRVCSNPEWKKHFEIFQSFRVLRFAILILVRYLLLIVPAREMDWK